MLAKWGKADWRTGPKKFYKTDLFAQNQEHDTRVFTWEIKGETGRNPHISKHWHIYSHIRTRIQLYAHTSEMSEFGVEVLAL